MPAGTPFTGKPEKVSPTDRIPMVAVPVELLERAVNNLQRYRRVANILAEKGILHADRPDVAAGLGRADTTLSELQDYLAQQ